MIYYRFNGHHQSSNTYGDNEFYIDYPISTSLWHLQIHTWRTPAGHAHPGDRTTYGEGTQFEGLRLRKISFACEQRAAVALEPYVLYSYYSGCYSPPPGPYTAVLSRTLPLMEGINTLQPTQGGFVKFQREGVSSWVF